MVSISEWRGAQKVGLKEVPFVPDGFSRFYAETCSIARPDQTLAAAAGALKSAGFTAPRTYAVVNGKITLISAPDFPPELSLTARLDAHPVFEDLLDWDLVVHNTHALHDPTLRVGADDPLDHVPLNGMVAIPYHGTPQGGSPRVRGFVVAGYDPHLHTITPHDLGGLHQWGRILGGALTRQIESAHPPVVGTLAERYSDRSLEAKLRGVPALLGPEDFHLDGEYVLFQVQNDREQYHLMLLEVEGSTPTAVAHYLHEVSGLIPYALGKNLFALYAASSRDEDLTSLALKTRKAETLLPSSPHRKISVVQGIVEAADFIPNFNEWCILANSALFEAQHSLHQTVAYIPVDDGGYTFYRIEF